MNQEREDYGDLDLPAYRHWPWGVIITLLVVALFVFVIAALFLAAVANGPHFDN
jgi:hypothetical protein